MGIVYDRRPAWLDELPEDAEPGAPEPLEPPKPSDGFGAGPRRASVLSGNEVSYAGKAGELFWLHPSLGRVERVVMLTHMAVYGPTRTMELCGISGMSHKKIGATLRGLRSVGLIESRVVPGRRHGKLTYPPLAPLADRERTYPPLAPLADPSLKGGEFWTEGCPHKARGGQRDEDGLKSENWRFDIADCGGLGGGRRGHPAREWSITEEGRRWLWRLGWVTRGAVFVPCDEEPLREDVPEDPVEAVRRCAARAWLRPSGLTVAFYLRSGWRPLSLNRLCRLARMNPGIAQPALKRLMARGWVEAHPTERSVDAGGTTRPKWQMSAAGEMAFLRHVDALRRAGRAAGWRPDPEDPAYGTMLNGRGEFYIAWEAAAAVRGWGL